MSKNKMITFLLGWVVSSTAFAQYSQDVDFLSDEERQELLEVFDALTEEIENATPTEDGSFIVKSDEAPLMMATAVPILAGAWGLDATNFPNSQFTKLKRFDRQMKRLIQRSNVHPSQIEFVGKLEVRGRRIIISPDSYLKFMPHQTSTPPSFPAQVATVHRYNGPRTTPPPVPAQASTQKILFKDFLKGQSPSMTFYNRRNNKPLSQRRTNRLLRDLRSQIRSYSPASVLRPFRRSRNTVTRLPKRGVLRTMRNTVVGLGLLGGTVVFLRSDTGREIVDRLHSIVAFEFTEEQLDFFVSFVEAAEQALTSDESLLENTNDIIEVPGL